VACLPATGYPGNHLNTNGIPFHLPLHLPVTLDGNYARTTSRFGTYLLAQFETWARGFNGKRAYPTSTQFGPANAFVVNFLREQTLLLLQQPTAGPWDLPTGGPPYFSRPASFSRERGPKRTNRIGLPRRSLTPTLYAVFVGLPAGILGFSSVSSPHAGVIRLTALFRRRVRTFGIFRKKTPPSSSTRAAFFRQRRPNLGPRELPRSPPTLRFRLRTFPSADRPVGPNHDGGALEVLNPLFITPILHRPALSLSDASFRSGVPLAPAWSGRRPWRPAVRVLPDTRGQSGRTSFAGG